MVSHWRQSCSRGGRAGTLMPSSASTASMSSSSFFFSSFLDNWRSGSGAALGGGLTASASACVSAASSSASSSAASSASSSPCTRRLPRERAPGEARRTKMTRLVAVCVLGVSRRSVLLCGGARGAPGQGARPWWRDRRRGGAPASPAGSGASNCASSSSSSQSAHDDTDSCVCDHSFSSNSTPFLADFLEDPPRLSTTSCGARRGARQRARAPSCAAAPRTTARAFLLLFFFLVSSSEYTLCATTTGAPPELYMPCAGGRQGA